MPKLVKGLAIAVGTGVAVGVCALRPRKPGIPEVVPEPDRQHDLSVLEPLFDRLDSIESRLETAESGTAPLSAELERRFLENTAEIQMLRAAMVEIDRGAIAESSLAERRFRQVGEEIPAAVEFSIASRAGAMRARLETGLDEIYQRRLEAFEKTVEEKVAGRMAALERTLVDQSASVEALREHAAQTDVSMQRLIDAIDRLCQQAPFQVHLEQAMEREKLSTGPDLSPRIVTEAEPVSRKPRIPMARLFVTLLAFGFSRFHG